MNLGRWLTPGIGIKRWLLVVFGGLLLLSLGVAHMIRQATQDLQLSGFVETAVDTLTLQFLPYPLRGLVVGLAGIALVGLGGYRLLRVLTEPYRETEGRPPLVEVIYQKRFLARGPRIVAIGGGTGLSTLLRGLKERTSHLTAVVTVADDGGSSGVLRDELGIPAVGDIRNCIAALADAEPLMQDLLQYRFPVPGASGTTAASGADPASPAPDPTHLGLGGHAVGNLLIAAMAAIEGGDFEEGVRQINRILAVRGQVVPASGTALTLHARTTDGSMVDGQSRIMRTSDIDRVWLTPGDVRASDDAVRAIEEADLIVIGPGSLYTSLLPNLLVPGIRDALLASSAPRLYVCNVATQPGETIGFDLAAHLEALERHTGPGIVDVVLANSRLDARRPPDWHAEPVRLRWPPAIDPVPALVLKEVVDPEHAHRHDPDRLADAVIGILDRASGVHRRTVGRTA